MTEKADVYCFLCKAKLPEPKKGEVKCVSLQGNLHKFGKEECETVIYLLFT